MSGSHADLDFNHNDAYFRIFKSNNTLYVRLGRKKKDVFSSTFPSEYKFACSCYSFFRIAGESLLYKKSKN